MTKQIRAYGFRQFMRLSEKERQQYEIKSKPQKEIVVVGYGKIKEQQITYRTRKYSTIVYRDSKGRFAKNPQKKIIPEKEQLQKKFFGELPYSRASVFIEFPFHSDAKNGINNYYCFGIIVIDKKENIDIKEMHEDCIQLIEKELHYKRHSLDWFDWDHPDIEYPKPFSASKPDRWEEKWSKTKK